MPGSVANAAPSTVLPWSLWRQFRHDRNYPVIGNEYKNGESQRGKQAETSRKVWHLIARLTPTNLATLRTFYWAAPGPHRAFYYYDPFETSPLFSYDGTGVATTGRYTVRFDGPWQQVSVGPRSEVTITLVQVA